MEFKINVGQFISSLTPIIDVSIKNTVKEFESSFMIGIESTRNGLVLRAHGGNASIHRCLTNINNSDLNYECFVEGYYVVEAKKLMESLVSFQKYKDIVCRIDNSKTADGTNEKGEMVLSFDDEFQSLPISKREIHMPTLANDFSVILQMSREVFMAGMQKVSFASGIEEFRPKYLTQVIEFEDGSLKFISGNGGRFAIDEISGKNIVKIDKKNTQKKNMIIFPKNNISNIINVLKASSSADIVIKEGIASQNNSEQIVIMVDDIVLTILGIDSNLKDDYPVFNNILNFDHPYQFKMNIQEWLYPTKGTRATYSEEAKLDSQAHNIEIDIDTKTDKMTIKASTNMRSLRKIKNEVLKMEEETKLHLKCNSLYIAELVSQGYTEGELIMKVADEQKPLVFVFPENTDISKGITEKYTIFFVVA